MLRHRGAVSEGAEKRGPAGKRVSTTDRGCEPKSGGGGGQYTEEVQGRDAVLRLCFVARNAVCTCGASSSAQTQIPLFPYLVNCSHRCFDAGRETQAGPSSYVQPTAYSRDSHHPQRPNERMRLEGLEPPRACAHTDLNRARRPVPPQPRNRSSYQFELGSQASPRQSLRARTDPVARR